MLQEFLERFADTALRRRHAVLRRVAQHAQGSRNLESVQELVTVRATCAAF